MQRTTVAACAALAALSVDTNSPTLSDATFGTRPALPTPSTAVQSEAQDLRQRIEEVDAWPIISGAGYCKPLGIVINEQGVATGECTPTAT